MNSIDVEEKYSGEVVTEPEQATFIVDSVTGNILRFSSWSEAPDAYHFSVDEKDRTVTVRKYLHPSNKYYLVKSESFSV